MILEIAQIDIKPGMEKDFEAGVKSAGPIFKRAKGCKFMTLAALAREAVALPAVRAMGDAGEPHQGFPRVRPTFQEWRKLVGHCFAAPPQVEHVTEVVRGF